MRSMSSTNRSKAPREYVYRTLKHDIMHLHIKPGTKISEKDISLEYKVSRTPVREAFVRLAQEELLDIYPQRGTFVSRIDLGQIEEARFLRETVEKAVIEEACLYRNDIDLFELESSLAVQKVCQENGNHLQMLQSDDDFHQLIFATANKRRTWQMVQSMNVHYYRLRVLRLAHDFNWDNIIFEHGEMIEAIRNRAPDKAIAVIRKHLYSVAIEKDALKSSYPDYFN